MHSSDMPNLQKIPGVKAFIYPSMRGWWLGMTWRKEPFNDMHVRRTIAWAMPYETLLQVVTQGLAERLRSCVPNNVNGYVGDLWPYETDRKKAQEELAQSKAPNGFSVTMPVYAGEPLDEEASVIIKESLAPLGIKLTLQKMPTAQKNSLLVQKQVDMAVYSWRPRVTDAGYFIYWNWLPESFSNYWSYVNAEAQTLGNDAITMAIGSPERNAKLRRFQEIVNADMGLIPLFTQFDTVTMRDNVHGYVYYPDGVHVLSKLNLA
jgi:peptide/nickel transport system substrate-binding protein